MSDTIVVAP